MNIAVRPLLPFLLGTVLLTVAACDDGEPPSSAGEPSAAGRWTGFAKECPALPGARPGKRTTAPFDRPTLYSLRCQYVTTAAKQQRIVLSVTVYRAAGGGGTAEQLAVAALEKDRAAGLPVPSASPSPSVSPSPSPSVSPSPSPSPSVSPSASGETEPIEDLGDSAFVRLVPEQGVRVYARSSNALVQVDYTDPRAGREARDTAAGLAREALTHLR